MRKSQSQKQKKQHKTDIDSYSSAGSMDESDLKKTKHKSGHAGNIMPANASVRKKSTKMKAELIVTESDTSTHSDTDDLNGMRTFS